MILLVGGGCTRPEEPALVAVDPPTGVEGQRVEVTIHSRGLGPLVSVDFARQGQTRLSYRFAAMLGKVPLEDVRLVGDGLLAAQVPGQLYAGEYDLEVAAPDGRTLSLAKAFRVLTEEQGDQLVASYRFSSIGDQTVGAAFPVTVEAVDASGAVVPSFNDALVLSDVTGTVVPSVANFVLGAWSGSVEVRDAHPRELLTATDARGRSGTSNVFAVVWPPGDSLRFTSPPGTVRAGDCTPAITVQLVDAAGFPSVMPSQPLAVSGPVFADAACSQLVAGLTITGQQTLHTRFTSVGDVDLVASSAGLSSARQRWVVTPGGAGGGGGGGGGSAGGGAGGGGGAAGGGSGGGAGGGAGGTAGGAAGGGAAGGGGDGGTAGGAAGGGDGGTAGGAAGGGDGGTAGGAAGGGAAGGAGGGTAAAVAVKFLNAPLSVAAGTCAPVSLQLVDALGLATVASTALVATLSAAPAAGAGLYSDAACLLSIPSATFAVGVGRANVYFRGTAAGAVTVQATIATFAPVTQLEQVLAGPATQLVITTPAQVLAAGACSAQVSLELRDAFGNPAPKAAPTVVSLAAAPAAGFSLYSNACTTVAAAITIPAGQTGGGFYFRGTLVGTVSVSALASPLPSAGQTEQVTPGVTASFRWGNIASPRNEGSNIAVSVTAVDAFNNVTPAFVGQASLTLGPSGALTCRAGCTALTTNVFAAGTWSGTVAVGAPVGQGRVLTATSGAITGLSNLFAVTPTRLPPLARFSVSPAGATINSPIAFDGSASADQQTAAGALRFSWDVKGQTTALPPNAPWTAFSAAGTMSNSYTTPANWPARLAVRDADGDVGYAVHWVEVPFTGLQAKVCVVTSNSMVDDGATDCIAGAFGPDGQLTLKEAARISNAWTSGVPLSRYDAIVFAGPMTITSTEVITFTDPVELFAPAGVVLDGLVIDLAGTSFYSVVGGLEFTGATAQIRVRGQGAILANVLMHDAAGVVVTNSNADLEQTRLQNCVGACLTVNGASATATAFTSRFETSSLGIDAVLCGGGGSNPSVDLRGSVFTGVTTAVRVGSSCANGLRAVNNTFHGGTTGLDLLGGAGHVLRNNIFSSLTSAVGACLGTFTSRDYHLFFQTPGAGCLAGDPNSLTTDPWFVDAAGGDFRLQFGSPARDTGVSSGVDVTVGPGNFLGPAPDRGGEETW